MRWARLGRHFINSLKCGEYRNGDVASSSHRKYNDGGEKGGKESKAVELRIRGVGGRDAKREGCLVLYFWCQLLVKRRCGSIQQTGLRAADFLLEPERPTLRSRAVESLAAICFGLISCPVAKEGVSCYVN